MHALTASTLVQIDNGVRSCTANLNEACTAMAAHLGGALEVLDVRNHLRQFGQARFVSPTTEHTLYFKLL